MVQPRKKELLPSLLSVIAGMIVIIAISLFFLIHLRSTEDELTNCFNISNDLSTLKSGLASADDYNTRILYEKTKGLLQDFTIQIQQSKNRLEHIIEQTKQPELKDKTNNLKLITKQYIEKQEEILRLYNLGKENEAIKIEEADDDNYFLEKVAEIIDSLQNDLQVRMQNLNLIYSNYIRQMLLLIVITALITIAFLTYRVWRLSKIWRGEDRIKQELIEAKEEAKKSALVKEQFLANMSHEIRTPLNAILRFTSRLLKTEMNSEQKHFAELIHNSSGNLLHIVNDVLDVSKMEEGMFRLEESTFSPQYFFQSMADIYRSKAQEKNLAFHLNIENKLPDYIRGDNNRLAQIMHNILSNALKFTHKGSIELGILSVPQKDNHHFTIQIKDSGIGIPKDKLGDIFNRFQQAEKNTYTLYGGTGLGLHIVKQLVEMMRGRIDVESTPGKGTLFMIHLPFRESGPQESDELSPLPGQHFKQQRILIVEDNPMNISLMKLMLEDYQLRYDIAENGSEAIEALKEHPFHLILMDIQMPVMNGYEATEIIRNQLNLDTPIVAMTAYSMAGEKEKCMAIGMNDYLTKPLNEDHLLRVLKKYLDDPSEGIQEVKTRLLDLNYLSTMFKGNTDKIRMVLSNYENDMPDIMKQMAEALNTENKEQIQLLAHRMKSTMSMITSNENMLYLLTSLEEGMVDIHSVSAEWVLLKPQIHTLNQEVRLYLS